jgi:F0F1-type ATP synthase epsilon subunit
MGGKGGEVVDSELTTSQQSVYKSQDVVQVNIPAESGEMGVLANHVASIEQLKPGLIEVIEESGGSKQFFRKHARSIDTKEWLMYHL